MVFVDDGRNYFRQMRMCHMIADSSDELFEMARKIGVACHWVQFPGSYKEHFDICQSKRALALRNGAIAISGRELTMKIMSRKPSPPPDAEKTEGSGE